MKSNTNIILASSDVLHPEEAKLFVSNASKQLSDLSNNISELIKLKIKQQAEAKTTEQSLAIQKEINKLELTLEFIKDVFDKNPVNIQFSAQAPEDLIKARQALQAESKNLRRTIIWFIFKFTVFAITKYIILPLSIIYIIWRLW